MTATTCPVDPAELLRIARAVVGRFGRDLPAHIDRDDLVGAAMVRIYKHLPRYDPTRAAVTTWATMHAHGAIRDHLRDTMFGSRSAGPIPVHSLNTPLADDGGTTVEHQDLLEDTRDRLGEALATVTVGQVLGACQDPRDRWLLWMLYIDGMTQAQVAGRLGVTESRVSQLHTRALDRLHRVATRRPPRLAA